MKNIPIITFIQRTWMLFLFALVSNWLTLTEKHFAILGTWEIDEKLGGVFHPHTPGEALGAMLYVPALASVVVLTALAFIHLFFRATIDADAHDGTYAREWRLITPFQRVLIANITRGIAIIGFCILCSSLARGGEIDEAARWQSAQVNPRSTIALDSAVALYQRTRSRYQTIEAMRPNGVPAPILFCLHYRESDNNFRCHAHEGSPLVHRTRDEPKGRLLSPNPPYTFEQSAEDAYYVCERPPLDRTDWHSPQAALDKMESFNGFGYRAKGIAAPYLWSGTSLYHGGKYVRDGVFSRTAQDGQLGCAAILKRMIARGVVVSFNGSL